jgi:hypothetical protein
VWSAAGRRKAIEATRAWARGEMALSEARAAALAAHAAARDVAHAIAACGAARAAGHAAATAHVVGHAVHAASYAVKAAAAGAATEVPGVVGRPDTLRSGFGRWCFSMNVARGLGWLTTGWPTAIDLLCHEPSTVRTKQGGLPHRSGERDDQQGRLVANPLRRLPG